MNPQTAFLVFAMALGSVATLKAQPSNRVSLPAQQ
jgi:hypothetical protein